MPTKLKKLEITKVDLCKAGADPDADILIFKSLDQPSQEDKPVPKPKTIDLAKATPEEIKVYVEDLQKTLTDQDVELEKAVKAAAKPVEKPVEKPEQKTDDELMKALPEPLRKRLENAEAVAKAADEKARSAEEKATKAEVEVAKAKTAAELVTIQKMVETDMPKVPGTLEEVAKMLQEAKATLTAASYAVLEKALKSGSAAIAKAAEELGGGGPVAGSALEEINKRADKLVSDKECKTRPEAIEKVAKSDPALYTRYKDEQQNRRAA